MDYERYAVVKIWVNPEIFRIVFIRKETSWETSSDLTEDELRVELGKLGLSVSDTDSRIERARRNPV
jgi:hypothetical protein